MRNFVLLVHRRSAALLALAALLWAVPALSAQELKPIQLPKPEIGAGIPLMQALARRQTTRAFLDKPLPPQTLSNLLWAAFGVNVYDAEANLLRPVVAGDLRAKMGAPPAGQAAVTLVYVASANLDYAQVDVGFIGQNVYLFAASEGLNAWFYALHGQQDATAIAAALKLPAEKRPLYAQSVGYPPK
jgi:nitroreductase